MSFDDRIGNFNVQTNQNHPARRRTEECAPRPPRTRRRTRTDTKPTEDVKKSTKRNVNRRVTKKRKSEIPETEPTGNEFELGRKLNKHRLSDFFRDLTFSTPQKESKKNLNVTFSIGQDSDLCELHRPRIGEEPDRFDERLKELQEREEMEKLGEQVEKEQYPLLQPDIRHDTDMIHEQSSVHEYPDEFKANLDSQGFIDNFYDIEEEEEGECVGIGAHGLEREYEEYEGEDSGRLVIDEGNKAQECTLKEEEEAERYVINEEDYGEEDEDNVDFENLPTVKSENERNRSESVKKFLDNVYQEKQKKINRLQRDKQFMEDDHYYDTDFYKCGSDAKFEDTACDFDDSFDGVHYKSPVFPIKNNLMYFKTPQKGNFVSPDFGWKRAFEKYSPSKDIYHSPVKHCEANLRPTTLIDKYISGSAWVLSMSEQFYYDNSLLLIHKYYKDKELLNNAFRFNTQILNTDFFAEEMINVVGLGSGTFGDVYRVTSRQINEYFAIKHIKKSPSGDFLNHTRTLLAYIQERNSLIRARSSPYVIHFQFSVNFPNVKGLFLFFEWCICDMRRYIQLIEYWRKKDITNALWRGHIESILIIIMEVYRKKRIDLYDTTLVYIFEVFCVIDFLAQCNIVHQDLKPENIMIGSNLHLKVGDFGLSYNTHFICRESQLTVVHRTELSQMESTNYEPVYGGTPMYEDMELSYRSLMKRGEQFQIFNSPGSVDPPLITDPKEAEPNFLSDLWSCGYIATELIFAGAQIFNHQHLPAEVFEVDGVSRYFQKNLLTITYNKRNYERLIKTGFVRFGGDDLADLMAFLASIFTPRQVRCQDYVKEKEVRRLKNIVQVKHIDIKKVEQISIFKKLGLESSNAFLYNVPHGLALMLHKERVIMFKKLGDLLNHINDNADKQEFFKLEPGIQITCY